MSTVVRTCHCLILVLCGVVSSAANPLKLPPPLLTVGSPQRTKISIVGVGNVGMACAASILGLRMCQELCLMDINEDRVAGEVLDLQHGQAMTGGARITGSSDAKATAGRYSLKTVVIF